MIAPESCALIMIDMQRGFIDEGSPLCVAGAAASVPACARALEVARSYGLFICHINRIYAADGSNVEAVRREAWAKGGRPLSGAAPETIAPPDELAPRAGELVVLKPRFSAFFHTDLNEQLRAAGVGTVVLTGTTTPNCIRSTCYDALSLNYNVVIVEDATSSRSPEVQAANIADMAHIGAQVITSARFAETGLAGLRDVEAEAKRAVERGGTPCTS